MLSAHVRTALQAWWDAYQTYRLSLQNLQATQVINTANEKSLRAAERELIVQTGASKQSPELFLRLNDKLVARVSFIDDKHISICPVALLE